MLASTTSAASFSISSLGSPRGERGRAMRPVRVDSRIPKGPINLRKESIREGLAELRENMSQLKQKSQGGEDLHFDDAVVGADIQNLTTELVGQAGDSVQVLMLVAQSLTLGKVTGVVLLNRVVMVGLVGQGVGRGGDLAVVLEELLEELRTQNRDLSQQQLTLHKSRVSVVQDSPDRDEVIQLAASLLDNAVLTLQHNGHAREVLNLSVANDQTVDVEATSSKDTRHTRQHTGLVLDEAVQNVPLGWVGGGHRSLIENG